MRGTSVLEGLPIASSSGSLKCGVAIVGSSSGEVKGLLEFEAGIEEVFDVRVNPYSRSPFFSGPDTREDGTPPSCSSLRQGSISLPRERRAMKEPLTPALSAA